MRKPKNVTTLNVYQENVKTGARSPYITTQVSNNVKVGEMAKTAIDQVRSFLHLVNKFPNHYKAVVSYVKI